MHIPRLLLTVCIALLFSTIAHAAVCSVPQKNIQLGQRDSKKDISVAQLQQFLNTRYSGTIINGYFGPKTKAAVLRFQKEQKLPQTGKVGPQTRARMQQLCGTLPRTTSDGPDENDTGPNCKVLYDGCNVCFRDDIGGPLKCTMRACPVEKEKDTICKAFFGIAATQVPTVDPKETVCTTEQKTVCGTPYRCLTEDLKESMPRECTHGTTFRNRCMLDAEKALFLHEGTCAQ
jgi:hypothetical protein